MLPSRCGTVSVQELRSGHICTREALNAGVKVRIGKVGVCGVGVDGELEVGEAVREEGVMRSES